jgi:hypothetical protein
VIAGSSDGSFDGSSIRDFATVKYPAIPVQDGPPQIATQPVDRTNFLHTIAAFTVTATGSDPLNYKWFHAGTNISFGADNSYVISDIQAGDAGDYWVVVSNTFGAVTSTVVTLTIAARPGITGQPQSRTNHLGTTATFSVSVTGTTPILYQWQRQATNLPDQTSASLSLANVQFMDQGAYDVVLSNQYGSITSQVATLTVIPSAATRIAAGRWTNHNFLIQLVGVPNDLWVVQRSTTLTGPWVNIGTLRIAPDGTASIVDTNPPVPQAFYRLASNSLTLAAPKVGPADVELTLIGAADSMWIMQRALSPLGPWTNIGSIAITPDGMGHFHDTNPPIGSGFYRARQP